MKVLLTNDDGIDAPGIQSLYESVRDTFGNDKVIVVAPDRGRSECGHSVTTGRKLTVTQTKENWFAIDGTPVDCVRAGLGCLLPDADLVISGVNAGANLGVDLMVSGTFAAAREAALHQIPSMAVSHYRRPDIPHVWQHVPRWLAPIVEQFVCNVSTNQALLWNVNLPAIDPETDSPPCVLCDVDPSPFVRTAVRDQSTIGFELDFHARPRKPGLDVDQCFSGSITISQFTKPFF